MNTNICRQVILMLLPTKGLSSDRALLTIGAQIISLMKRHMSESEIWDAYQEKISRQNDIPLVTFDWFSLALTMLFTLGVIKYDKFGRLELKNVPSQSQRK
ncbi:ABC-three component system middle component 6 [Bifidobacterium sp. ESL0819]|uniref:ABC-three component system middle component 6 n=1 Tax=Bifidobacterium sp. ESL0819 TaxID=3448589 RepID=UPI0040414C13